MGELRICLVCDTIRFVAHWIRRASPSERRVGPSMVLSVPRLKFIRAKKFNKMLVNCESKVESV